MQQAVCRKYGTTFVEAPLNSRVGVARNVKRGLVPINGLRHRPDGDMTGWFIWTGEQMSDDPDFFHAIHVAHLEEERPEIVKFLGLPPGWRFLKAGDYEDAWFDEELLKAE